MAFECKFEDNSTTIKFTVQAAVNRALEAVGLQAEGYAKIELSTPKEHADGSVRPNVDTGRLRNSITHTQEGNDTVVIGTNVEYAPYVEMGTSKSRAYPYLQPAVEKHIPEYEQIFETHLKSAT